MKIVCGKENHTSSESKCSFEKHCSITIPESEWLQTFIDDIDTPDQQYQLTYKRKTNYFSADQQTERK